MPPTAVEILLIEDNPADVELGLAALRRSRVANEVHVCRDGEEALEYLFGRNGMENAATLRLVLLDLKLPKVDGMQVLRAIKSDPRTRGLPVVVLTSSREERDLMQSYDLGVNSYIQKPVDFEQFRDMVRQIGLYWLVVNQPAPLRVTAVA
jgi:two-component system, response regulator